MVIKKNHQIRGVTIIRLIYWFLFILAISQLFFSAVAAEEFENNTEKHKVKNSKEAPASQLIKFRARKDNGFLLAADYYYTHKGQAIETSKKAAKNATGGVIVLHDCKTDRSRYKGLSRKIALQGLHTISLDLRGYGESTSEAFSALKVKKQAENIVAYYSDIALLTSYWLGDLLSTYELLRDKVGNNQGIAIVASGCSAPYAVALADKIYVSAFVLISPLMSYVDIDMYKNLMDIPSYFIGARYHLASYETNNELFNWNGDRKSKMQLFKGNKHDQQLIQINQNLDVDIALWLKQVLE